jgi:hypothetical protein
MIWSNCAAPNSVSASQSQVSPCASTAHMPGFARVRSAVSRWRYPAHDAPIWGRAARCDPDRALCHKRFPARGRPLGGKLRDQLVAPKQDTNPRCIIDTLRVAISAVNPWGMGLAGHGSPRETIKNHQVPIPEHGGPYGNMRAPLAAQSAEMITAAALSAFLAAATGRYPQGADIGAINVCKGCISEVGMHQPI